MRFDQLANEAAAAAAAADLLEETVRAAPHARVILPAGRTPRLLYAEIVRRVRAGQLDLTAVRFFQLDEYIGVGRNDARSFHALLRSLLLDPLHRTPDQDELLDGAAPAPLAAIERHAARLTRLGGADLALLGIGANGHVAFNEPGTTLGQRARVVALSAETRAAAQGEFPRGRAPTRGMTLGLAEIAAARRIGLLATGSAKAHILATLFDEPPTAHRPASLLLGHADFTIFADVAAAAELHATLAAPAPVHGRRPAPLRAREAPVS